MPCNGVVAGDAVTRIPPLFVKRGCVLGMPLHEGAGNPKDLSGRQNHGTIDGAAWTTGRYTNALLFDGVDDLVSILHDLSFNEITTYGSWLAWIFPTGDGDSDYPRIIHKDDASSWSFYFRAAGAVLPRGLTLNFSGNTRSSTAGIIQLDEWQHVAVTFDSSLGTANVKFYRNGIYISAADYAVAAATDADNVTIGNNPAKTRSFEGKICEAYVFNRVLSAAEISAIAHGARLIPDVEHYISRKISEAILVPENIQVI